MSAPCNHSRDPHYTPNVTILVLQGGNQGLHSVKRRSQSSANRSAAEGGGHGGLRKESPQRVACWPAVGKMEHILNLTGLFTIEGYPEVDTFTFQFFWGGV